MDWGAQLVRKPKHDKTHSSATRVVFDLMNKVTENKRRDREYKPKVRFSKFPLCGLLLAREITKGHSVVPFSMDWFAGIGTAIHEAFQLHFPLTEGVSAYVFGDWRCTHCVDGNGKPAITARLCTTPKNSRCPRCKKLGALRYNEIEVNYKGVTGHVDLLLCVDGVFYLLDWKSCSQANIDKPDRFLPYPKNVMQIQSYACALKHQYNITITNWCLIYVSRDSTDLEDVFHSNKKRHHFSGGVVSPAMLQLREKQLEHAVQTKKVMNRYLQTPTRENLKKLDAIRPCHSVEDYNNRDTGMKHAFIRSECPYLDSCCGSPKLTRAARELHNLVEEKSK